MSASPMARKVTDSQAIPTRNVVVHDPSELPSDCASTPGGTLYSTTPGGTRIVYEKTYLMNLRNSPFSQTPPTCDIPAGLIRGTPDKKKSPSPKKESAKNSPSSPPKNKAKIEEEDQFALDL